MPPAPEKPAADWMGSLKDRAKVTGDIVTPASDPDDWDVLRR